MKKLFITLTISFSLFQSYGQIDSMSMKTGPFSIQARDAEYISSYLSNNEQIQEFLYDKLKQKFKAAGEPTGATIIQIDSVRVSTLIFLSASLRSSAFRNTKNVYNRIDAAIRACNNSFLTHYLQNLDKKDDDFYNDILQTGRKKLKRN